MRKVIVIVAILVAIQVFAQSAYGVQLENQDSLRQQMGLTGYPASGLSRVRVAVLDNGFQGYVPGLSSLPASARLIEGPKNPQLASTHGLGMAEILWGLTGRAAEAPQFLLVNANGYSNLAAAVDYVIQNKIEIVLYSQIWEFGTNFDGSGLINALVSRATAAGVIWINAAGNSHELVYDGAVTKNAETGYAYLPGPYNTLRFENKLDDNTLNITLSWNDFKDTEDYNTSKDLDLFLLDESGKVVASSELIQRGEAPLLKDTRLSSHAREVISARGLARGNYSIKVAVKSDNFTAADHMRVLLTPGRPGSIRFVDHSAGSEVMAPADNASALTVGDCSELSAEGPTLDGRAKPDVLVGDSSAVFTNGDSFYGSSTAAAMVAASVAMMKAQEPALSGAALLKYAQSLPHAAGAGLTPVNPAYLPAAVRNAMPEGSQLVRNKQGRLIVLTPVDPLRLPIFAKAGAYRANADDFLLLSPTEWRAMPKKDEALIPSSFVEFRQGDLRAASCADGNAAAPLWRTPRVEDLKSLL